MIKEFIIFIICGIIITLSRTNTNTFVNFALNLFDTHIKVRGLKNLKNFNNKPGEESLIKDIIRLPRYIIKLIFNSKKMSNIIRK